MIKMFEFIGIPLGWIMYQINSVVHNYGLTLIIFSILTRILMIPLGIKQQKGMIANARMQPKMQALQKAYGNNRQRYSEELQKLYAEEKFSPLSSCLPMAIQMPILFGMLDVIYYPIKHMLRLPADVIASAIEVTKTILGEGGLNAYSAEISVINAVKLNPDAFVQKLGAETTALIADFDFSFLGLFLGDQPTLTPDGKPIGIYLSLLLIPVLSGLTSFLVSKITMGATQSTGGDQMKGMNMTMTLMMPMMSVWISFIVPAGVGLYWLISNVLQTLQTLVLNKVMNPAEEIAKAKALQEEMKEKERLERIEAKKYAKEHQSELSEKAMSQKELNRKKLAAARRRDAERYGEDYVEATDKDLD